MLFPVSLTLLALTTTSLADQAVINAPNSALQSQLSSLSSLFLAKPTPGTATDRFCCSDDCPPGACNINNIVPTDLGYAFPAPSSTPATPSSELNLPCCGPQCPDGACRTTPIRSSARPTLTAPPRHGTESQNIVIGCCSTCHGCDQFVTSITLESVASATVTPEVTASASLADAESKHPVERFPGGPLGSLLPDICIGCGRCTPCDFVRIATWVDFLPDPTSKNAGAAATTAVDTPPVPTAAANVKDSNSAEPTIFLASDVVDAINGQNQDFIPLILQNGGVAGILGAKNKELRTILAAVDLKLADNYISRRMLQHLSRLGDVTPYPGGLEASVAVISQNLTTVSINATIVLDIVAGDDSSTSSSARKLFRNVRFNVYGDKDDEVYNEGTAEVILGARVLREMNAVTVFSGFRSGVQAGVRVVERAHFGKIGGGKGEGVVGGVEGTGHDEL